MIEQNTLLNMPTEDYFADMTGIRSGWLSTLDQKSPAHLKAELDDPETKKVTPALRAGQIVHSFVLEPDSIASRYYLEPEGDRRTKAYREAVAALEAQHAGMAMVNRDDWLLAQAIKESVYKHKAARKLLGLDGENEQSLFWTNDGTGELCKARYDKLSVSGAFIADIKTSIDASPAAFAKSIVNYNYSLQARHYSEPVELRFVWIVVEKTPPYAVAVYADNPEIHEFGARHRDPALRTYAECKASGNWPSYPDYIQHISLPRWAR